MLPPASQPTRNKKAAVIVAVVEPAVGLLEVEGTSNYTPRFVEIFKTVDINFS